MRKGTRERPSGTVPATGAAQPCSACGSCMARRDFVLRGLGTALLAGVWSALPRAAAASPIGWLEGRTEGDGIRYPVPADDGVQVDRGNELIVVRHAGLVAAFALSCPHQRSMLKWREKDGIFRCTKHGSEYSPDGAFLQGRATRNMDRLGIRLEGAEVVVDPATVYKSDEDAAGWAAAVVRIA